MISIISPSLNGKVPQIGILREPHEFITSSVKGIAAARNDGASRAKGNVLAFIDSDITVKPIVWKFVEELKPGEFIISYSKDGIPSGRLIIIHREDFERVGFDARFVAAAEDSDFYLRCRDAGLDAVIISNGCYEHKAHSERAKDREVGRQICRDQMRFVVRHMKRHRERAWAWSTVGWQLSNWKFKSLAYELFDFLGFIIRGNA